MDLSLISTHLMSLLTLTLLEIVLGIDNLIFIAAASSRLPLHQQKLARRIGLLFALITRLLLLASAVWLIGLTNPLFTVFQWPFSGRDLLLISGGFFLIYKGIAEIKSEFEIKKNALKVKQFAGLTATVIQIAIFDIIFSLDSVLTAVGLTQNYSIMACAIIIAILVMLMSSESISRFVHKHPQIRMLAWSFLLMIGGLLVAEGIQVHIPRGYIYCAVGFSLGVEILNNHYRKINKNR